jgi:hypothetical protein
MTAQAAEARRAYKRKWAKQNPEKIRQYQQTYWNRKAAQAEREAEAASRSDTAPEQEGGKKA